MKLKKRQNKGVQSMRLALQLTCALLVLIAAYLLFVSPSAPDGWPVIPDAQGDTLPTPRPSPIPTPPADETHEGAFDRSAESGRPVILLFGQTSCPPCRTIEKTMLPAIRAKGELARIDVEKRRDLYDFYCPSTSVPHLMVYERSGNSWKFRVRFTGADQIGAWANPGVKVEASGEDAKAVAPTAETAKQGPQASAAECSGDCATCPNGQKTILGWRRG